MVNPKNFYLFKEFNKKIQIVGNDNIEQGVYLSMIKLI